MRYGDISVNSANNVLKPQTKVQNNVDNTEEEIVVIPQEEKEDDLTSPVDGYHIDKTTVQPDDDDDEEDDTIDTGVDPDQRIKMSPSVALNNASNQLTNALDAAVDRASNTGLDDDDPTDNFFTQAQGLQTSENKYPFFSADFKKKNNLFGKAVFEANNYKYSDSDVNMKMGQLAKKLEFGGVFTSESNKTKFAFFTSGAYTNTRTETIMQPQIEDADVAGTNVAQSNDNIMVTDNQDNYSIENDEAKSFSAYVAARHNFNNGDILSGSAFLSKDGVQSSRLTSIGADYYLNKYKAALKATVDFYKQGDNVSTSKVDFSCYFNPENETDVPADGASAEASSEKVVDRYVSKTVDKKFKFAMSPFLDTKSYEGNPEQGLGIQTRLRKRTNDSKTVIRAFGKASTTPRGEKDALYHLTFGSSLTYKKNIGARSVLKADVDVKDKVTFGQGNILTALGNVSYASPEVSAELEGKYIKVPNSSYAGVVGRVSYTPNKNVHLFGEGGYVQWNYPEGRINGASAQIGAVISTDIFAKKKK